MSQASERSPALVLRSVCVYSGAKGGNREAYAQAARDLGVEMARRGIRLVYGGGSAGLMGAVAAAARDSGAQVLGIIPTALMPKEISGEAIGEIVEVADMHERKAKMAAAADAFIALPGGFGTLEELLEMMTWSSLGIHSKPVAVLNVDGFYDPLLGFFDHVQTEGFMSQATRSVLLAGSSPSEILDTLQAAQVANHTSWQMGQLGYAPALEPILGKSMPGGGTRS
eukprot:TRINITY_DN7538_c0_g1_i2.p1 TRINITY_DN7538_c0_g1~~TRINITY_DN7538_c0_g1_i2.p1  ORF type:complete len:226 (-),score=41.70 TRINITY_DN7538_c0_g1_i2:654-1331(-)